MIVVLKLISGEEIIGRLECETDEEFDKMEQYELFDPMWIVSGSSGAMKLRDALMLSNDAALIFIPECCITCYKPSHSMVKYYNKANEYSLNYGRASVNNQIEASADELDLMIEDENKYAAEMAEIIRAMTGSKLH